jgi:PleD family two-component response regulator
VTVSVGVCTSTPAIDSNWEELELVAGANKALTLAKQQGRNRIAAVEGQPEDPNV